METLELIKKEIINTGYIEDVSIGSYFHMKHKELYNKIIEITNPLEKTYKVNLLFRGRVLFVMKYNCDLSMITNDRGYLTFDRKIDDFIDRNTNYVKQGWNKIKKNLCDTEVFNLSETKKLVNDMSNDNIFGRGKNRVLTSINPKLYNSILFHSNELSKFNKNNNKFPSKIIFIRDYDSDISRLLCEDCKVSYVSYNPNNCNFNKKCKNCYYKTDDFYPQIGFFKKNYGDNWEEYYKKDRLHIKNKKVNSLTWFINKYGEADGLLNYKNYAKKRVDNIIKLSINACSKISQELFWLIYKQLSNEEKINCHFKELNEEISINKDGKTYIADFVYKNKIIEYDGSYWHDKDKDIIRNSFYYNNGYEVLIITDDQFNRQKKTKEVINKCVNFLKNEK
jgi:hypothetical protein